jgi:cardiolipin synthase
MAETLTRIFYKDVEVCRQLTIEEFEKRSKWIRFKESIARLVSPIL